MTIPSYPENRREEYLNNIATGSGEIPPYPENREEQYLDAIARNGGGGGSSSLPEVSAEDNGDVLTVVDGAWAKATPSGGGGLVVTVTDSNGYYIMDKTWQEIHDAFCNGNAVVALYTYRGVTETGETYQETADTVTSVEERFTKEGGEFSEHYLTLNTTYLGGFEAQSKTDYPTAEIW